MHLLARVRLMVARHPWTYWVAIAALSGALALGVARAMAGVDAARRSWGEQHTVWTASAAIDAGQAIIAGRRQVPRAVVPAGAVDDIPSGVVARQHIGLGEIITDADITTAGPAGLIPDGWVAFAVPATVEHFATGDHLEVYAAEQLVAAGLVVDRGESELMVAIPADAAPAMTTALLAGAVTLGLSPGP
jgi:hypothetical protein